MLKGRGRDPRAAVPGTPAHLAARPPVQTHPTHTVRGLAQIHRAPLAKPEPDYEVVEFPSEQYVNAKLQPPPPPPPRPPTGHPADAGASCGLCGGGGARVRCAECGRRALCASCDDMYHRHPKRRHHQRQALSSLQLRDERPPLPPKVTPPVPPPRRHKLSGDRSSASPKPPGLDQRRATLSHATLPHPQASVNNHTAAQHQIPAHLQRKLAPQPVATHLSSMPFLPTSGHHAAHVAQTHVQANTMGHLSPAWSQQRASLPGFMPHNVVNAVPVQADSWESPESISPTGQTSPWGRPLRRGTSVLELGGGAPCAGCAHCAPAPWRYGSCASLDHPWAGAWPPACCVPQHPGPHGMHMHPHSHMYPPQTPQSYRRADSRTVSRAASRTGSRAASPAVSVRSRASRRTKHRTPSPPPLPSSDADSESESESDHRPPKPQERRSNRAEERQASRVEERKANRAERQATRAEERQANRVEERQANRTEERQTSRAEEIQEEDSIGPAPPPPTTSWQCEHCTFVNEPGERVCAVCCRTPTAAPRVLADITGNRALADVTGNRALADVTGNRALADVTVNISRLRVAGEHSPTPVSTAVQEPHAKHNGEAIKRPVKERASTGCGPSPPRDEKPRMSVNRLVTPTREYELNRVENTRVRHDMAVGPSPPREHDTRHNMGTGPSPPREANVSVRASPYQEPKKSPERPTRHSVSVGPSPPRDSTLRPTPNQSTINVQKKSTGTSPPREAVIESRSSSSSLRANVSNTGTSPPPQNISTQTYEAPGSWERAPSASRSRPRRRFKDDGRRDRSHSRHSLSSDTRESERSARTSGGGRWEWRGGEARDSSPGAEWSDGERRRGTRLTRRASHLDLRRSRPVRRSSFYGSEAPSPEPLSSNRTVSLEAMASAGTRREAERGLELARLMTDAERLGFSAAEVHAALAQNPAAPLSWLRERWPSLCAGVRAAAARLTPGVAVGEREARAALARHRGAMWPAVTECVERHRRLNEAVVAGEEGRLRGRVWGSPAGADDDAAPPARRTQLARDEDSSDEFEAPTPTKYRDDDWMYLPLEPPVPNPYDIEPNPDEWSKPLNETANGRTEDIAHKLKSLLIKAGVPSIDENLLLKGLLADNNVFGTGRETKYFNDNFLRDKPQSIDLVQSEIDFIDAYNALTRLSPLPNIKNPMNNAQTTRDINLLNLQQARHSHNSHNVIQRDEVRNMPSTEHFLNNQAETQQKENSIPPIHVSEVTKNETLPNDHESVPDWHVETHAGVSNNIVLGTEQLNIQQQENRLKSAMTVTDEKESVPNVVVTITNNRASPKSTVREPNKTVFNTKDSTNVSESTPKIENHREEERTSNLSDIVDNTQKLIQQMKEEINSDINSLDGRSRSQSEHDNSSNDDLSTEHESSYSESEKETDDITSDENGAGSEDDDNIRSEKSSTVINRTSSEDNEQFEEAMDHIEEQNENFRQTNIEILDSIARSLQEEHTISVEVNQIETPKVSQNQTIESHPRPPKLSKTKIQDSNNNLFAAANSFEEIYEQLSEQPKTDNKAENIKGNTAVSASQKTNSTLERREIELVLFTTNAPTKLIIENKELTVLNAIMENIEEPLEIIEYESLENQVSNFLDHLEDPLDITEELLENNASKLEITTVNINIEHPLMDIEQNNQKQQEFSDKGDDNDNAHSDIPRNSISPHKNNRQNVSNNNDDYESDTNTSSLNKTQHELEENKNNNNEQIRDIEADAKAKSKSPEKSVPSSPSDTSSTKTSAMKSNIPKLVRILTNNKSKVDKTPKVIASKVPVRRGSIKQYPAPEPPKTHFGNIQSGHVKQLQSRLFNNKSIKVVTNPSAVEVTFPKNPPVTVEIKASTSSTLNKKRPAPLPPSKTQGNIQASPPKSSPPKEKKNHYFRESCRTEDEWTESDSEDSQLQIRKPSEDEPQRVPSPPPPVTLRRVSGQLIDLARVRLLEGSPERQARMLLAEGAAENWEQAQLAVELVTRGADPPAALLAALECVDLNAALTYLHQDCELCASRFPEHEMVSMLRCTHRCCRECAQHYFTVQISERSIADCVCPYCKEPELESLPEDSWLEYFAHLDILLKTLLDIEIHELFQRKLRDRTLARDPNFRWCVECSSGFFVHPKHKKLRCPECKSVSCATCRKPWSANHEGMSCEQYASWLEDNDPERSVAAVQQHLRENGLECPRCHFKYSLSRGGCMHFTCTQCKYEFCYGCGKPFTMGARCGLSEYCAKLGLHAHHPRNCLFYLRDKEPHELQTLLQMNNVTYETEAAEGSLARCPILLQRETPTGLVDGSCGGEVAPHHAGLCKAHYVEYLAGLARALDPIPIMEVSELVAELRRRALPLPERGPWDTDPIYAGMCAEIVKEKIPLD